MDFTELNLNETLMTGINASGYVTCTPVQEQVLKGALDGSDLYVQSQTGTGKTAAYLISIIQEMLTRPEMAGKKALIMVPTRELAVQVEQEAKMLAKGTGLKVCSFYGGVGYDKQKDMLKTGVDILVGTPGRVIDLQEGGSMDLSAVAFLVIDEADRMFDMGFYPDLRTLLKVLSKPEERQTMLFSATLNTYVKNLAWEYTVDAKEITIEAEQITVEEIDQVLLHVSSDEKMRLLLGIINNEKPESVIIFCNTKRSCEVVAKRLQLNSIESEFIIGDLPQSKRLQVLESFKRGSLRCLVATDVAARGIDVNDLSMVVNYDLPNEAENYVHRIGRTARAGKTGKAYSFCSEQDVYNLPAIERYLESPIPASMPSEEMLAEDKSAGVYIKTNRYDDEEYGDHRESRSRDGSRGDRGSNRGRTGRNTRSGRDSSDYGRGPRQSDGRGRPDSRRSSGNRNYRNADDNAINPKTMNAVALAAGNMNADPSDLPSESTRSNRSPRGNNRDRNRNDYRSNRGNSNRSGYRNDSHRNDRENSITNNIDMSKLSFDERMKLYKEKYSSDNRSADNRVASANDRKDSKRYDNKRNGNKRNYDKRNDRQTTSSKGDDYRRSTSKNYYKNRNNTAKTASSINTNKTAVKQKKPGIISRLKTLFGRGK